MNARFLFVLKLFILSIVITFVLHKLDFMYRYSLVYLSAGIHPNTVIIETLYYVSAIKLYPFFVLLLATPNLKVSRHIMSIIIAIGFYLLLDVIMIKVWGNAPFQTADASVAHIIATHMWHMLGTWLLPFLLWFIVAGQGIKILLKK